MTNEELHNKLSKANRENDTERINQYVDELNALWDKASVEMLKNAEKDGVYRPDKP